MTFCKMVKPRFVIDTNVLVSGILIFQSSSDQAYKKARSIGKILFSESSSQELEEILKRPKFNKYVSLESRNQFITKFKLESEQITITETINICRDSKDNKFLELAINGNADFIITGDQDLLVLNPFRGIKIITVNQFLKLD